MIEKSEIISVLDTEEGKILLATYTDLYLKKNHPGCEMNSDFMEAALTGIIEGLSQCTVPDDFDTRTFILGKLAINIQEMEKDSETSAPAEEDIPPRTSAPVEEYIPPRPLPTGSRYLNPEEVNWLLKYEPEVKEVAEKFIKWFRKEHGDGCKYMDDDAILETSLDMLFKLNRRDPAIVSQFSAPPGPSFFKPYEEGTPEEIVIRYLESYIDDADDDYSAPSTNYSSNYSGSSYSSSSYASGTNHNPSRKEQLIEKQKQYKLYGIICILVFWPLAIYFFYKASQIGKEIDRL